MNEREAWRKINDQGYWISNKGRVFSEPRPVRFEKNGIEYTRQKRGRYLKINISPCGYPRVNIMGAIIHVHALIGEHFLGRRDWSQNTINHKDLNKQNNCVENLEVISNPDNVRHAWKSGAMDGNRKSIRCIDTGKVYPSVHEASRGIGLSVGNLCSHLKGRQKTYGGLRFEYFDWPRKDHAEHKEAA